jgi:flavin-binding protein dodecin
MIGDCALRRDPESAGVTNMQKSGWRGREASAITCGMTRRNAGRRWTHESILAGVAMSYGRKAADRVQFRRAKESGTTQKIIEVIGTSKKSFAKAAEQAVAEAAKTVRGIKWAHVDSLDMQLDGAKVLQYRATTKIYFDVEH